jgi:hypothetical protein
MLLTITLAAADNALGVHRVLFVAGEPSHGPGEHRFPAGCALLAEALNASGPALRADVSQGWPADDSLAAAQTIVLYSDGLDRHVAAGRIEALRRHVAAGKGLAVLHFALEPSRGELSEFLLETIGGYFDPDWSVNPVWTLERSRLATHEVTRGVAPFALEDEWYYHLRFRAGVLPVLQAVPPAGSLGADGPRSANPAVRDAIARGELQTLAWVFEGDGARRGFGFTGGHFHGNWAHDDFRKLVLNGIAWTAGVAIPEAGIASSIAPIPRYSTIDEAIARGDVEDVRRHLTLDPQRAHGRPDAALTPLHQSILRNRTEIAVLLLDAGADVNRVDRSQRTPLHLAVERGNAALVETLLARKARPNEHDKGGWTPLHHAAAKDNVDVAKALLAGGANPMTLSARGGTPLHEAAASGSATMIALLLEHRVDPAVVSKTGVTALDVAREYKNDAAIRVLAPLTPARN